MSTTTKISAAEFQNNFGRYTDAAKQAPVVVTRYGRDELVVLSAVEYQRLRASFRRVVVLNETTPDEAAELFQALANAPASSEAQALDHLMDDDARPGA
ncbi:MAG: type II toxin-antitoxin system prevent-host-death family antitoxin [Hyphomonadaceae bacterium]|nr:type II toxin-antitoxin system prevent-host-death family antitoxin [Hyphomonadaceae bacterium]